MNETKSKVLEWMANGETGLSSETMAFWLGFGVRKNRVNYPHDPADFDRCLRLLEVAPELRSSLSKMKELGPQWAALVSRWDEIERCHINEVGLGWTKSKRANRTYELMRSILVDGEEAGDCVTMVDQLPASGQAPS